MYVQIAIMHVYMWLLYVHMHKCMGHVICACTHDSV